MNRFTHKLDALAADNTGSEVTASVNEIAYRFNDIYFRDCSSEAGHKMSGDWLHKLHPNRYEVLTLLLCFIAEMSEDDVNEIFPEFAK